MKNQGIIALAKKDPVLAKIIRELKLAPLKDRANHFRSLAESIMSQQISGKAADAIIGRFILLYPKQDFPRPEDIVQTPLGKLRKAGLSRAKALYVKDLARRTIRGELDFAKIHLKKDEEVMAELVKVKGVGRWTAEMFLIFSLKRPDVFSSGDLALRNAIQRLYKMKKHPTPKQVDKLAEKWMPHRSLAALYLWASLNPVSNSPLRKKN